ncbi:MAG: extracellular solute-binding protein, partial [bacterium]|nr:extracellular solute-binding protein [bacterium]
KIYFADNISPAHQQLIDRFNNEYRGKIEVVPINLPFAKFSTNERKELLARTLRSNSSRIDVFSVDIIWVPRFTRWSHPLDDYFSQQDRDKLLKYPLQSCYYENRLMAIPFYTDIGVMYYRQDIISSLPDGAEIEQKLKASITWQEFINLSRRFSHQNNPFYLFAADNYEGLICSFVEGIASQNQSLFDSQSQRLNTTAGKKSLQLLVDLIHKYQMTPEIVTKYDEFQCYLHALKYDGIFLRGWPGFLRHYRTEMEDTSKFQFLKMAPLPHFKGGQPAFVFGGWNLMISKHSSKKDEAMKFIKFTQLPENQKMMFQQGGYLPIINSIYQDTLFLDQEPDLKFYRGLMERGIHRPYMVDYTKISDILSYQLHLAIKKQQSVSNALEQASSLIQSKQVLIE